MSIKLMTAVWELDLPRDDKIIALAFADHAGDDGRCYPSIARIAWKCGYSRSSVQRKVASLVERGILLPLEHVEGGRGLATVYCVAPEAGTVLPPFEEKGSQVGKGSQNEGGKGRKPDAEEPVKGRTALRPQPSVTDNRESSLEPTDIAPAARVSVAEWMHRIWVEELGNGVRVPALTKLRQQKYQAMHDEQLKQAPEPQMAWRWVLWVVKKSAHHMSNRAYQMPESLLRSPERRDTWIEQTVATIEAAHVKSTAAKDFADMYRARRASAS